MILEATIVRSGKWWAIEVPAICAFTQARSRAEALRMAASVVDDLAEVPLGTSASFDGDRIVIRAKDTAGLIALVLRQRRSTAGLSLRDMAARLGAKSVNTYARYEQGRAMPSVAVLDRLLQAVDGRGLVLG